MTRGADVIETDIPVPLGKLIFSPAQAPKGKAQWFQVR
jgi:hypothetical protein